MSSDILNLDKKDPFADAELDSDSSRSTQGYVHIRVQQRNTRKTLTTIQGLSNELDHLRILKACKKIFCCNGCVVDDEVHGIVLQLQGDHRQECAGFLVSEGIVKKDLIKLHGA